MREACFWRVEYLQKMPFEETRIFPRQMHASGGMMTGEIDGPDYHDDREYFSRSDLATFATSRSAFKRQRDAGKGKPGKESDVLKIGSGTHAIALRDTIELDRVKMIPETALSAKGKRQGNAFTKFRLKNRGKRLYLPAQWELCQRIAGELDRVPIAETSAGRKITVGDLAKNPKAEREVEFRWTEILPCRLKADLVLELPDQVLCIDLKTARSVAERSFWSEVAKRKLWLQVAHYSAGLAAKYGKPVRFIFCAIEKVEPFAAECFELDRESAEIAKAGRLKILEQLAECLESGVFQDPPKPGGIKVLKLTAADMGIAV
jgi:hypothetical protein